MPQEKPVLVLLSLYESGTVPIRKNRYFRSQSPNEPSLFDAFPTTRGTPPNHPDNRLSDRHSRVCQPLGVSSNG